MNNFIANTKSFKPAEGFTLVELLVAATVSTIIAGSALFVLNEYNVSTMRSSNRRNLLTSSDNTLRIITNEVKQSSKIYPSKASMKKLSGGGLFGGSSACLKVIPDSDFLFALELPNQVMSKGDYYKDLKANDYKTRQIKNFIASDCNYVFYGIQKNQLSNNSNSGPFSLYRIGYDQTVEGYYNSNSVSKSILNTAISDSLTSPTGQPKKCDSNYHSIAKFGVQACIDSVSQRTLHLSLVSQHPNHGSIFFHTKSGSASTSITDGGTDGLIDPPCPTCCDFAVFYLDISGSMNAVMKFSNPKRTRIEYARTELINAVKNCPDGSPINVCTFNGGNRGSCFKSNLVALSAAIRDEMKRWLDQPGQQPGGGTNPWPKLEIYFPDPNILQYHVISDGFVSKSGCFLRTCGDAALIFKAKNDSRDPSPLTVYSYSLDEDFCTGNNPYSSYNWIDARWMGRIADSCKVVQ